MKRIWISEDASSGLISYFKHRGFAVCTVKHTGAVGHFVSAHPDIYMCRMGGGEDAEVFQGDPTLLGALYPADIRYNAVVTEKFFISLTKYTDSTLMDAAQKLYPGISFINVPQGYTKCNMVVVDGSHFITEDAGIYKALSAHPDISCLLVSPGTVSLKGFKNGFLGGSSGRVGSDIFFNGDLSQHPDFSAIKAFIDSCGLGTVYFPEWPLTDIGSIISE